MKFIQPDGTIIEEGKDGILFDIELFRRVINERRQKKRLQQSKRPTPSQRRQNEINKDLTPLKFNVFVFCILLLCWPLAVLYVVLYNKEKKRRGL